MCAYHEAAVARAVERSLKEFDQVMPLASPEGYLKSDAHNFDGGSVDWATLLVPLQFRVRQGVS